MAACVMFGLSASCGPDPSKNKCNSQVDCLPGYSCTNGACLTSGGGTAGGYLLTASDLDVLFQPLG